MKLTAPARRPGRSSSLEDVQIELTQAIFHKLLGTVIIGSLGVVWLTIMIARLYHDPWMWTYVKAVSLAAVWRILIVAAFVAKPARPLTIISARRWQRHYEVQTLVMCVLIALGSLHNFQVHDTVAAASCVFGTFCTVSSFSGRVGVRPWVLQLAGIIAFSTIAYSMATSPNSLLRVCTFLIVLYIFALARSVSSQFDIWLEQVRGRYKLRDLAERDILTGLANRRHFQRSLETKCQEQTPFAILYIDLDRFKHVNDTLGHAAGDTLLRLVAVRLHACLRSSDLLARLGGDEFAIIQCPLLGERSAQQLAERINRSIAESFGIDGHQVHIGASIGIQLAIRGTMNPDLLLSTADRALYRVKKAGGGSFSLNHLP